MCSHFSEEFCRFNVLQCCSLLISIIIFSVDHSLKMLALTGDGIEKVNKSLAK